MKDVYIKNPQMGDPASVDPRLTEIAMNIEKLQAEVQKFEVGSHVDGIFPYPYLVIRTFSDGLQLVLVKRSESFST